MQLREFVRDSIIEVMNGVQDAQAQWKGDEKNGAINPIFGSMLAASGRVQRLAFDVAVTVSDQSVGGVGGGIKVFSLDLSGKSESQKDNTTVSRIQFEIPFLPPATLVKFEE